MDERYVGIRIACETCDWEEVMPTRETAEHVKRVHQESYPGHAAFVEREDEE